MINGIINVYKEKGYTSHDVVAKLRGILKQKKIGHTGTLDPDATGVLPVCLGKGTKLCDMLTDETKTYEAGLLLGKTTDTQDITGTVLEEKDYTFLSEERITACIKSFEGEQMQIPPMYSARKVNGRKLYELAREGKTIERKARPVTFFEVRILSMQLPHIKLEVTCSKGTYIRTLCNDIGEKLGCGGCMESLVRRRVGRFGLETALTLKEIEKLCELEYRKKENLRRTDAKELSFVHSIEEMFEELPAVRVAENCDKALYNGNSFHYHRSMKNDQRVRMYTSKGEFIGIYRYEKKDSFFHIEKMFYERCEVIQ